MSSAPENDVEASPAPVPPMRAAYGCNVAGVPRGPEPIVHCGADPATLNGRFAGTMVAGDQEDDAVAAGDRGLEPAIDGAPRLIEVHSVQVDDAVEFDAARTQSPDPAAIEGRPELR